MMKGRANISGTIAGRGSLVGTMAARAAARGMIDGQSRSALKPIPAEGERTRGTGLFHWPEVAPTSVQLDWNAATAQTSASFTVTSNTNWSIE